MTRHVLGVLGVIAAGVLLAVSAMMNYRFGYSLGKTPSDGHIYGLASAAADCFKALVPFFFFAAWRNRMWSQALAAAAVWFVVTGYSMTSALGHAALNRLDTSGQRAAATATYKDLRDDLKLYRDKLSWLPPHRAAAAVQADLEGLKSQYLWHRTGECNEPSGKVQREFCQGFRKLEAERANALEADKHNAKIDEIGAKLAKTTGATVMAEADPQASVLAKMTGFELEKVQMGLTLFVALLIEIGSGFGMYVAFAYWRTHTPPVPAVPAASRVVIKPDAIWSDDTPATEPAATKTNADVVPAAEPPVVRPLGVNDNQSAVRRPIMPPSEVQRFYREQVVGEVGSSVTLNDLYGAYCDWSKEQGKNELTMPMFSREFRALGVRKEKIGGRIRYFDIALRSESEPEHDDKPSASVSKAA